VLRPESLFVELKVVLFVLVVQDPKWAYYYRCGYWNFSQVLLLYSLGLYDNLVLTEGYSVMSSNNSLCMAFLFEQKAALYVSFNTNLLNMC
jgi:hypothetical protein